MQAGNFQLRPFQANPGPTLARALNALSETDLTYYVHAGTALGFERDGGFMHRDTDIDIAVHADWGEFPETDDVLLSAGFRAAVDARIDSHRSAATQMVYVDPQNADTVLDVEVYYAGLLDGMRVHVKKEGYIAIPDWLVDGAMPRRFCGLSVPMPDRIEGYLAARYGPDWRSPVDRRLHWHDYTPAFVRWE